MALSSTLPGLFKCLLAYVVAKVKGFNINRSYFSREMRLDSFLYRRHFYGEQLEEQAIGSGVSPDQVEVSVNRAIEGLPAFTGEETLPRPKKTKPTDSVGQFADILLQRPDSRRLLQVFSQKLGELNAVYQELEEMLGPPRLDNALVAGHCRYCPVP